MKPAPRPENDPKRLTSLKAHAILNSGADDYLDELATTTARRLGMPIAQINFIDAERQWTMAAHGLPRNADLDRNIAFCSHTILRPGEVTVVADARSDPRFHDNPIVLGPPGIRFYAGACVTDLDGLVLGAICVADTTPHDPSSVATDVLIELARIVSSRMDFYRVTAALRESEDHYRNAVELNPQIPFTCTPEGKVEETSPRRWLSMVGTSHGKPRGDGWQAAVHPDDLPATLAHWAVSLRTGERLDTEYRLRMEDGSHTWVRARAAPRRDATGKIIRWYGTLEDIDDRKLAELALIESQKRLQFSLRMGGLGSWELDFESGKIIASEVCARNMGLRASGHLTMLDDWIAAIHQGDRDRHRRDLDHARKTMLPLEAVYRLATHNGSRWIKIGGQIINEGGHLRMVGFAMEAHRHFRPEVKRPKPAPTVPYNATHDELTGLANHQALDRQLAKAVAESRPEALAALLILDLDGFKNINLTFGTDAGDKLLRLIAARLSRQVREGITLARSGGDQFAVLMTDAHTLAEVDSVAIRLLEAIDEAFEIGGQTISIEATVGIALAAADTASGEDLKNNALAALYKGKATKRGDRQVFEPSMAREMANHDALRRDLRKALTQDELLLLYQPVIDFSTGRIAAFEALLRWRHPTKGILPPSDFIPLAEKTGWMVSIGRWALREACREAANWPGALSVTVNLSPSQFSLGDLETDVSQALSASGLHSSRLELEVTEAFMLTATESSAAILQRLRRLGVRIVLDDFGSGYSSVTSLARLGFDKVKIDQSVLKAIPDGGEADMILRAIVGLAESLSITTAAAGVETGPQRDILHEVGCTQAQGFLFSRPVTASAIPALLTKSWGVGLGAPAIPRRDR